MIVFGARFPQSWGRIVRPEPTDCSPPGLPDPPLRRRSMDILLILLTPLGETPYTKRILVVQFPSLTPLGSLVKTVKNLDSC